MVAVGSWVVVFWFISPVAAIGDDESVIREEGRSSEAVPAEISIPLS